jgi:predicted RNA-binding protein with RPS1 domain
MKISLIQSTSLSSTWIRFEVSDVCTKVYASASFDPYENLYIWMGQIRDLQLPASMIIDEEGRGVEFIAEKASNEMIQFRIEPWLCGEDTTTRLTSTVQPYELIKAFHNGISEFIQNEDKHHPFEQSFTDSLSTINWDALLSPPKTPSQNWQKRLSMSRLGSWDGNIDKIEDSECEKLTQEQQWLIVLRDVLVKIAVIAKRRKEFDIQALAILYSDLPVDIALSEIDRGWYQGRRNEINKVYGVDKHSSRPSPEEWKYRQMLTKTRLKILSVGQIVDGTVVAVKHYGLFVDIGGCKALIHISSVSQMPVERIDRIFKHGDWIRSMILAIDIERVRVTLSTSVLEVEPGDMLKYPLKVYETAEEMADRYYQNVLSKQEPG